MRKIYNGILACTRDNDLVPWHIKMLDSFGREMRHCLYYGQDQAVIETLPHHILPMRDTYESLPVKVWAMLRHALTLDSWDVFVKSDVNGEVTSIDWDAVDANDFVGWEVALGFDRVLGAFVISPGSAAFVEPATEELAVGDQHDSLAVPQGQARAGEPHCQPGQRDLHRV